MSMLCCSLVLLAHAAVVFLSVMAVCVYACMSGVLWCIALFVAWCVYARCLLRGVYMRGRGSRGATVVARRGRGLSCAFSVVCLIIHCNSWNHHDPHLPVSAARERERSYRPSASFILRERKRGVCERGREGGREGESGRERARKRASERERSHGPPASSRERGGEKERERERERSHRSCVLSTQQWPAK
jgi:hypothetical protein